MALYLYNTRPRRLIDDWMMPFERSLDALATVLPMRPSMPPALYDDMMMLNYNMDDGTGKYKSFLSKDGFQVSLDVQHFAPNEISVKTENNQVVINAKHEEKRDNHGYISREFTRRYILPDDIKSDDVTSTLSSDGVLTVKAPRQNPAIQGKVREVQIQQTGPARLNVTTNKDDGKKDMDKKSIGDSKTSGDNRVKK